MAINVIHLRIVRVVGRTNLAFQEHVSQSADSQSTLHNACCICRFKPIVNRSVHRVIINSTSTTHTHTPHTQTGNSLVGSGRDQIRTALESVYLQVPGAWTSDQPEICLFVVDRSETDLRHGQNEKCTGLYIENLWRRPIVCTIQVKSLAHL